jgi:hypothetical protein
MKKEMLVCKINSNGYPVSQMLKSLRKKYGDSLLGFRQNGGTLLFFSKELLGKENYYFLLSSLSAFGRVSRISVVEVDLELLLKDMRCFSYFARNKV